MLFRSKPLKATDFTNGKTQQKVYVKPGDIKISKLYAGHTFTINGFLNQFRKEIGIAPPGQARFFYHGIGKSAMWGLRRIVDMAVNDKNPNVGYQLNYRLGCYVTESMQNKIPDLFETTS